MFFESVIYEEELDFYEAEIAMERCSYETDLICDLLYCESDNDKSDDKKNENLIKKVISMFKTFIEKCRNYLKKAIDKITGRITDSYKEHKLNDLLKDFNDNIKHAEKAGVKSFKFIDIDELQKVFTEEADKLEKEIDKFSKAYVKHGRPKDAELMVKNIKSISDEYTKKINDIKSNPKEYSINDAKMIAQTIEEFGKDNNTFTTTLKRYQDVCSETEKLVVSALNSLNKYSEDTGYVQNAKTLKDIIHNSSITIQSHATDIVTKILKDAIPFIINFKRFKEMVSKNLEMSYNKAKEAAWETVNTGKEVKPDIKFKDLIYIDNKPVTKAIKKASNTVGIIGNSAVKSMHKVSRKNDIKKWKETKDNDSLSFDNRPLSKSEIQTAAKHAAAKTVKDAAIYNTEDAIVATVKKVKGKSDNDD